jgi:hypothetical protein
MIMRKSAEKRRTSGSADRAIPAAITAQKLPAPPMITMIRKVCM